MTTLGTHPFIPAASKLGAPIPCQRCPNDASHPVHDWLTPTHGAVCSDEEMAEELMMLTPEEMVQLENLPNGEPFEDINGIQRGGIQWR